MGKRSKIAVVTNNGYTVSQHFGRARYYVVVTLEDGRPVAWETRERLIPHDGTHGHHEHHHHEHHHHDGGPRGFGQRAGQRHAAMLEQLKDCDVLIAGGMGLGAYQNMTAAGLKVIVTDIRSIKEAVDAYIAGVLVNKQERVH